MHVKQVNALGGLVSAVDLASSHISPTIFSLGLHMQDACQLLAWTASSEEAGSVSHEQLLIQVNQGPQWQALSCSSYLGAYAP